LRLLVLSVTTHWDELPRCPVDPAGRWHRLLAKNNQAMACPIDSEAIPELDRMCEEYPDTPVIIDHLARIGQGGVIRDEDMESETPTTLPPWTPAPTKSTE
jgi:hypothetical protein